MQAKVLQIEVDYIVNSGTFVAGSSSADRGGGDRGGRRDGGRGR